MVRVSDTDVPGAATMLDEALALEAAGRYSVLTKAFTGRLGRGLGNRVTEEISGKEESILPFPLMTQFMSPLRQQAILAKQIGDDPDLGWTDHAITQTSKGGGTDACIGRRG